MAQQIRKRSWFRRFLGALLGFVAGVALMTASFYWIFWNEGHDLPQARALQEVSQVLIRVPNMPIDPNNNLQVVSFSGMATSGEVLKDVLLGVSQQAIKLIRKVEMYQWEEQEENETKKETIYAYTPVWSEALIDSHHFKNPVSHLNPSKLILKSQTLQAKRVRVGDFILPAELAGEIKGSVMMDLSQVDTASLEKKLNVSVLHNDHGLYIGKDSKKPAIGDIKITVMEVLPQTVSVIAQQSGKGVRPYRTASGQTISLLEMGDRLPQQMIKQAETIDKIKMDVLRLSSFLTMFIGFFLAMKSLAIGKNKIPYIRGLFDLGIGLTAFVGGLLLWSLALGIAWFSCGLMWSFGIIVIALVLSGFLLASRMSYLD